jgi:putative transposase
MSDHDQPVAANLLDRRFQAPGPNQAVMESFFWTVKSELRDRFDSCGEAKIELFDYIEVFYTQRRRHSTLGQISPAAFERRAMTQAA